MYINPSKNIQPNFAKEHNFTVEKYKDLKNKEFGGILKGDEK